MNVSSFLQIQKSSYLKIVFSTSYSLFHVAACWAVGVSGGCSAKDERGEDKWLLSLLFGS